MWEIVSVSPKIPNKKLIKSGMNIGWDIIGLICTIPITVNLVNIFRKN